ncbi:2-keto-3-deoxygluconate permease [Andreprevotia chitinilytica]|uniref:2-keto-3-deoxygluconate permease n=1 Tax=Andreprevotia chitinilytica TaxID=396808 RepID=UPI000A01A642|nr:2-keto-3-deoxygluconate permease [Andreprevotia chitinilytica]
MRIMKTMQKVPGGMMVVPLLIAACLNTFWPGLLRIGGFTEQLFVKAAAPLIALYLLSACAGISVRQVGLPLKKGMVLFLAKIGSGVAFGLAFAHFFGAAGFWGLTPLAVIPALTAVNGGLYGGLAGEVGDRSDMGAMALVLLGDSPFFTLAALGASGMVTVSYTALIAVILPMFVGFVLGNLDEDWKKLLTSAQAFLVPFFAWALGANMNLKQLVEAGPQGILLGVMVLAISGGLGYLGYRLFFRSASPAVGIAVGSTAGLSVAFPAAVAQIDPSVAALVPAASAQISSAVIFTVIFCPLAVSLVHKMHAKSLAKAAVQANAESPEADTAYPPKVAVSAAR